MRKTLPLQMLFALALLSGCATPYPRVHVPGFVTVASYILSARTMTIPRPTCDTGWHPFLGISFGPRSAPRKFRLRVAAHAWLISHALGGGATVYCARHSGD